MNIKTQVVIGVLSVLLSAEVANTQPNSSPPTSTQATPALSSEQREEIEQIIEDELEKSVKITERVQSEVDRTFGWTVELINLLITVLIAIPIITGLAALFLRQSIIDQLVRETKKQFQEETAKEVKQQLEVEVATQLKQQVELFKQELEALKSACVDQLQHVFISAQHEKEKIFKELSRLTPALIQEEFVTPEIQQKIQELTQQLEELKVANPQLYLNADDYISQGHALWYEGRYEDALKSYDQALSLKADIAVAWSGRGKTLDKLHRYEEALESYKQALQIVPDDFRIWFGRGYTLRHLKRYEEALNDYDKVTQLKPDYHHAWNHKAYALLKLGRTVEALESLAQVRHLNPNSSALHYNQAYYYALQGKIDLVIKNLEIEAKLKERAKAESDFDCIRDNEQFKQFINA